MVVIVACTKTEMSLKTVSYRCFHFFSIADGGVTILKEFWNHLSTKH